MQTEYSLFERQVEELGIVATLNELNIGLVAYSPLGRGFISGEIKKLDDMPADDFRRYLPRFQGEQFEKNIQLLNEIEKIALAKGITSSQLAIAWVIAKGHLPIPGTKRVKYLEQNIAATSVALTNEDMDRLENIIPLGKDTGARYDVENMKGVNL